MKRLSVVLVFVLSLFATTAFAAGDLTVQGTINAGPGGIKFSDGTTQTTSARRLVCEVLVTAPTNNMSCAGLDGHAAGGYDFELILVNTYAGVAYPRIFFNNDQTMTGNRYYSSTTYMFVGTTTPRGTYDSNIPMVAEMYTGTPVGSNHSVGTGTISITPDGYIGLTQNIWRRDGVIYNWQVNYNITAVNLTRIDIVHPNGNYIGVNSRLRLWKKM